MKGMTAFACMSDIDLDLIEESMALFDAPKTAVVRGRRETSALTRFFSSGWGVAVICTFVSVAVLAAIIWAGNRSLVSPPPPDTANTEGVTEPDGETTPEPDSDTQAPMEEETPTETASKTEEETEPATEGVFHPDVTEGGVVFISNGDGTCKIKGADKTMKGSITVPEASPYGDTVTVVATGAFKGFSGITSVSLPDTVTVIKGSAFQGCGSLKSVELPPVVTEFGRAMFDGCGELRRVVLPKGLTKIDMMTFQTCVSLQSVVAQEGVTSIEANAFNGCRSLHELTLPAGLKSIGSAAFMNCCGLRTIHYGGNPAEWGAVEVDENENAHLGHATVVFDGN